VCPASCTAVPWPSADVPRSIVRIRKIFIVISRGLSSRRVRVVEEIGGNRGT
jgi:hypothetical protein